MISINDFRNNILDSAFKASTKTFLPISLMYIITYIIIILVMGFTFIVGLGLSIGDLSAFADPSAMSNPDAVMNAYSDIGMKMLSGGGFIFVFLAYLIIFFIMAWFYNFTFSFIHKYVEGKDPSFGSSLSESFSSKVVKLFLLTILSAIIFLVIYLALVLLTVGLTAINTKLAFIGIIVAFLGIMVTMVKLMLAYPNLIISNKGIIDSLRDSMTAIDIKTALKYSLFGILGMIVFIIVLGIALFVVVGGSFMIHEALGFIVYIISLVLVGGFTFTFMSSLILGLFYKHSYTEEESSLELEENLIL